MNKENQYSLKETKYRTGCLYCRKEGHWQWECPDITCRDCGQKGHANSKGRNCDSNNQRRNNNYSPRPQERRFHEETTYRNVRNDGPLITINEQQYQRNQRKTCQECGRKGTGMNSIENKKYIIITNEICG